ncbi:hypothetical protein Krac_9159 [Ktedonobacter racemifer DSM 44963]|uniref:Uncharacterized protein n=1 Tax=Ktedonobacter racemifer DSM 44963 TaxID=485913 RepID=D6TRA9_KTERA|nr:hypothetical protein Krac_9159 [Ktedonobacter racemifer DSM 44963]
MFVILCHQFLETFDTPLCLLHNSIAYLSWHFDLDAPSCRGQAEVLPVDSDEWIQGRGFSIRRKP